MDAVRLVNLVELERISEDIVPGLVRIEQTRLNNFLIGKHIFVYDAEVQIRMLKKCLGPMRKYRYTILLLCSGKSIRLLREKPSSDTGKKPFCTLLKKIAGRNRNTDQSF